VIIKKYSDFLNERAIRADEWDLDLPYRHKKTAKNIQASGRIQEIREEDILGLFTTGLFGFSAKYVNERNPPYNDTTLTKFHKIASEFPDTMRNKKEKELGETDYVAWLTKEVNKKMRES